MINSVDQRVICLIPARGGSKGIPKKNLQPFNGIPLVVWKIIQASSANIDEIWVSTDDFEIATVASLSNASVLRRPDSISGDLATTESCIEHFIQSVGIRDDDLICLLQLTSPLIRIATINSCIDKMRSIPSLNSSLSGVRSHRFSWIKHKNSWHPENHSRDFRPRRQDLPEFGIENGGCYVFRVSAFRERKNRFPNPTEIVLSSYLESLDIDTIEDLVEAQKVYVLGSNDYINLEKFEVAQTMFANDDLLAKQASLLKTIPEWQN
jgi:N-acylneuraminate cytidylyltransferase